MPTDETHCTDYMAATQILAKTEQLAAALGTAPPMTIMTPVVVEKCDYYCNSLMLTKQGTNIEHVSVSAAYT